MALPLFLRQERDERRFEVFGADATLDLGRRARRDHVAAVHGREPGVPLGFVHVGGRDHHAHLRPPPADAVDQLPELPPRQRVDAGRRLVEDQEIGIVDQRAAERQLLLHAARELAGGPLEERVEAGRAGQIVDARLPLRLALAEQPADEVHIFEHAERGVEIAAEALRHVGDARVCALPERCVLEVSIKRPHLAGLDLAHAGDQPEQRRFADAVGADESGHPARGNGDRHVIERDGLAVVMGDAFERGGDSGGLLAAFPSRRARSSSRQPICRSARRWAAA